MELDERKEKILKAIIQNYLETGEPVGSRTISKYSDLKLSSATIRNEMSDLEELGYIIQPHTSAGRIPSDKGYRFYVDQLIHEKETEVTQVRDTGHPESGSGGASVKADGKAFGEQYELCDADQRTAVSPDEDQVYTAFQSGSRETPDCHCFRRQHYQELDCDTRCGTD